MTVYFQGSEAEAVWPNPNVGTYNEASSGAIESAWSRTGVGISQQSQAYVTARSHSNITRFWLHATSGRVNSNTLHLRDKSSLRVYTYSDTWAIRIWHGKGTELLQLQYHDGSDWVDVGEVFDFAEVQRWDLRVELGDGVATDDILEMYRNETLVASKREVGFLRSLYPNGMSYVRFYSVENIEFRPSQIVIADESTLDWKCRTIIPSEDGRDTDGEGLVTDVNERATNNNTFISFTNPGERRSFKALARELTHKVKGFTVAGRIRLVVETLPNKIRPYVIPAGSSTRYYGTTFILTLGYLNYQYTWQVNPETGTEWTTSEINDPDLEYGWEVVGG